MVDGFAGVPQYHEMLWPTLVAVLARGESASIDEITESVIKSEAYTEDQQAVLHGDGPRSEIAYRLAWARTYLKGMGLLVNSKRGVWSLTDDGRGLLSAPGVSEHQQQARVRDRWSAYTTTLRKSQRDKQDLDQPQRAANEAVEVGDTVSRDWKEQLLGALMAATPAAFERLAQRLLREAGFVSATVTGRTGDGGMDGLGVYRLSLLSFPVFFQCKRYKGSVGSGAVRDFRGAMAGRGDKGLLITTGSFTADAKAEANRDGAPPVDLIDGDGLCDLLKRYELGVTTTIRQVEDTAVDDAFFVEV